MTTQLVETKETGRWIKGVFFRQEDLTVFDAAIEMAKTAPVNILMAGPSGYGKTTLPMAVAQKNRMKYVRVNCARVRDPEEWFGYREAVQGTTKFVPTEFTAAVKKGNAIIVLDEFNRVEPWLHNTLYPLLDDSRETIVHNEKVVVGQNTIFCATVNLGYTFTGTFTLDAALQNRMDITVLAKELPEKIECQLLKKRHQVQDEDAEPIVRVMRALRRVATDNEMEVDLSTRTSLKIARLVKVGLPLKSAIQYTLVNALTADEVKMAIDAVNTALAGDVKAEGSE